jgi:tRNA-2-methylthio-N6-dimethylallyladenosine synthase
MVTFFNKIYGCQANFADSEGLALFLKELGCAQVNAEAQADLIIINTCAIREKAEQRLYSYMGKLAHLRDDKPYLKIGVIGCVASYRKKEIYEKFDYISFVHGAREEISTLQNYLAEIVSNIQAAKELFLSNPQTTSEKLESKIKYLRQDRRLKKLFEKQNSGIAKNSISKLNLEEKISEQNSDVKSLINIMTGCNKYCAYCIVPFTRGREISYPMSDILTAVKKDISRGVKEITLVGQNVNSYADPQTGARFPELLEKVAQIPGEFWVRFISPHPQDMTIDLFQVMAKYRPKLTAFLHFPLQSGSDTILKAMNRNYTSKEFLDKIKWAKDLMPDVAITTDIIVGFPGETEEDYLETRKIMELVKFDQIYSFIYSRRKFTKAFNLEDNCPTSEKARRLSELQKRQREISLELNRKNIGKTLKVLVEKQLEPGKLLCRTEGNARVFIHGGSDLIGRFLDVTIESTTVVNMTGKIIDL